MVKIKICGLRREVDVEYINELKPDYCGFILTDGFKRSIDYDTALKLSRMVDESVKRVGVFVDEDIDYVNKCISSGIVDIVQLHGDEDINYCKKINAPIIKVLKPNSFSRINDYEMVADYLLLDNGTGTGKSFDWSTIPKTNKPFFLAGGINKNNIKIAIETIKPYAVDVSSSVETDGYKDYDKIKEIMEIINNE